MCQIIQKQLKHRVAKGHLSHFKSIQGEMSALGREYIKSRDLDVIMPITLWGEKQNKEEKIK